MRRIRVGLEGRLWRPGSPLEKRNGNQGQVYWLQPGGRSLVAPQPEYGQLCQVRWFGHVMADKERLLAGGGPLWPAF